MRPRHSVIYTHGGGRLGNQIVRFLHWMAWVRTHEPEFEVVNVAFWPFAEFFATWRERPGCVFPVRRSRADWFAQRALSAPRVRRAMDGRRRPQRALLAAGRWLPGWQAVELDIAADESLELGDARFLAGVRRHGVTTCCGWKIASWPMVAAQQAALRPYFRPAPQFERPAQEFIAALRAKHDLVIGVLIRQSDYAGWADGRFFFATARYVSWMRQLLDLFPGKRCAFVVASEEGQDPAQFAGLPCFFATGNPGLGGHWFENWIELSACDFVVTPPSTFSATAAFFGDVPLWPVLTGEQTMAFEQCIPGGIVGAARHPVFSCSVK